MAKQNGVVAPRTNGNGTYGSNVKRALAEEEKIESETVKKLRNDHDIVLKTFRVLIADLCEQFAMGHPGGAVGMAAIGVALWKYAMKYAPHSPDWFNRDRFVLSNGHACLFQYSFLHLSGYRAMTWEMLQSYHSERADSLCPGHPEIEIEGIEVTTGPLGQGIANAVGLAMATKNLGATYNKPGFEIVNNRTWCMIGDACLQEGIGQEAISLAGHWKLDNLTVIYDNNQITCDGSVDMTNTEDINARMRACGWEVFDVEDGCFDVDGITDVLNKVKQVTDKPSFVNVRTIIGVGSEVAGKAVAHGAPFKTDDVKGMKRMYGFDPEKQLTIGEEVRNFFAEMPGRGEQWVQEWETLFSNYKKQYPGLGKELEARMNGQLPSNWEDLIPKQFPTENTPSRKSSGLTFNKMSEKINTFMIGTADLSPSVNLLYANKIAFQNPSLRTECEINGNYSGRYIHYGVREHAMAALANGLAAFSPGTIIPVTSSFFMFYLYAAPAVRMGALQRLQVIHLATHDSIGAGEDGPTHQPVELAALYRAMPNLLYIRPGDSEEVAGAYLTAIKYKQGPSIISCSRHALPQLSTTRRDGIAQGAYVLEDEDAADVTLIGVGAELSFATNVAKELRNEHGLKVRVVSFPCSRLFEQQSIEYRRKTLRRHEGIPTVAIEAYVALGWERYADAMICMKSFGHSLPGKYIYQHFGFETNAMTDKVVHYLNERKADPVLEREFVEL
ncbi:hypothetical protein MBLNU459_g3094t1 [Dothideomycetes sp. NU459]